MKTIFRVLCLFVVMSSSFAHAADKISLNFDKVPVMQFIEATYRVMLGRQYVVDPRLVDDARKVTIHVVDIDKSQVDAFVRSILLDSGVSVRDRDGVAFFLPATANERQPGAESPAAMPVGPVPIISAPMASVPVKLPPVRVELYRPRFRPVDQLQAIANNLLTTQFRDAEQVILAGDVDRIEMVRNLLEQYDVRPGEVLVRAAVYEFAESGSDGMNVQGALSVLAGKLGVSFGPATALQNAITFRGASLQAVFSALAGDTRFNLVSSPTLRVRDRAKARLTVGSETPVLDSLQLDKNGSPIQSITYRPSGVILDLTPFVMDDRIELQVAQEVSSFSQTSTSNINSPTLMKRSLQTVVGVESGELIVLGGLDEDRSAGSSSGLSFLPPFLRSSTSDRSKTQLFLVMEVRRL